MIIIPINTHYWFIGEVHESWGRNQRQSSCLTLPHYTKPNPNLTQNWVILWLFQPITQLCRNAHYKNTSKTHHYFIIKVHEFCHMFCNRIQLCSWSKQPQTHSILLRNMGWLGRIWQGWTENMASIALPVFMYLSDELIMTFYWDLCSLKPHIIPTLVNTALKTQVCSKILVGRVEHGEVGQATCPWFPSQDSCIFLMNYDDSLLVST